MDIKAENVKKHYKNADEQNRLRSGMGLLEFKRMSELLIKFLPEVPAEICDIGGGAGEYSFWLAECGYNVHLIDIVPEHIAQAKERAGISEKKPVSMIEGDALDIPYGENMFDGVFLAGPLYHLIDRKDRIKSISEAKRILKPGGILIAYSITRHASLMAGLPDGRIYNDDFLEMLRKEIPTGIHIRCNSNNPSSSLAEAYFHKPEELREEISEAGLDIISVRGVVGPAWLAKDFDDSWNDPIKREKILEVSRMCEDCPELGPRVMVVAKRS